MMARRSSPSSTRAMATRVVPMPRSSGSASAWSQTARLAARPRRGPDRRWARRPGEGLSEAPRRRSADATSPAAWPPMPSATAKSGLGARGAGPGCWTGPGRRRWPTPAAARSPADLHGRPADLQPVAFAQGSGRRRPSLIEVGAVGGPEVLDVERALPAEHPGVELGHEGVVGQGDAAATGPSDGQLVAELELLAPAVGRLDDDQSLASRPVALGGGRRGRRGGGARVGRPATPALAWARAARSTRPGGPGGRRDTAGRGRCTSSRVSSDRARVAAGLLRLRLVPHRRGRRR